MNILEIKNLTKDFATARALDNVSLDIRNGSVTGLLGPNGAGKTTLLRIINSILKADSGSVKLLGRDVSIDISHLIGYMPEERGLYEKMRIEDQILFFGKLKGGDPSRLNKVMDEYLDLFHLNDDRRRRIKELSKGNQQKVQIIATIVHEPRLVILDEPFSGFDPINGAILQDLIESLRQKGSTIVISSHNMNAVEEICDDIVLIDHGRVLLEGFIQNIKDAYKDKSLLLTTEQPISPESILECGIVKDITEHPSKSGRKGHTYRLLKNENVTNSELLAHLAKHNNILHFEEALPSLKDIFIRATDHTLRKS